MNRYAISVPRHATHLIRLTPLGYAGLKLCLKDVRDDAWRTPFDRGRKNSQIRSCSSVCGLLTADAAAPCGAGVGFDIMQSLLMAECNHQEVTA